MTEAVSKLLCNKPCATWLHKHSSYREEGEAILSCCDESLDALEVNQVCLFILQLRCHRHEKFKTKVRRVKVIEITLIFKSHVPNDRRIKSCNGAKREEEN